MLISEHIALVGVINLLLGSACLLLLLWLRAPLYHPLVIFCLYYLAGFVARPIIIATTGYSAVWARIGFSPEIADIYASSLYSNICLLGLVLGPVLLAPKYFNFSRIAPRIIVLERPGAFYRAAIIVAIIGLLSSYLTFGAGGETQLYSAEVVVDSRGGQRTEGLSGYVTVWGDLLPSLLICLLVLTGRIRLFLAAFLLFIAIKLWIGVGRKDFVLVTFATITYLLVVTRRGYPKPIHLVIAVVVWSIFDLVGTNRLFFRDMLAGNISFGDIVRTYKDSDRAVDDLGFSDTAEFDVATAIFSLVPEHTGYNWGSQYLRYFVWVIPRFVWPDKPIYTALIDLQNVGDFFGFTWSLPADLYSNCGGFGLLLLSILIGLALSGYFRRTASTESAKAYVYFFCATAYLPLFYRDGASSIFYNLILAYISASVLCFFGKPKFASSTVTP